MRRWLHGVCGGSFFQISGVCEALFFTEVTFGRLGELLEHGKVEDLDVTALFPLDDHITNFAYPSE